MQTITNSRIDDYIDKAAPFAKPILQHLRMLVHQACPGVAETIKWGMPFFEYKGLLCNMAAFKQHCSFGFYKASLLKNADKLALGNKAGIGHLGRITSLGDLPPDEELRAYIREAAALNEAGVKKTMPAKKEEKQDLVVPPEITELLETSETAKANFQQFSYSAQKEYIDWIVEAKTKATRGRRLATMLEWIQEGKGRNWKYERK